MSLFRAVRVSWDAAEGYFVNWELLRSPSGSLSFYVQRTRAGGDWETVSEEITDNNVWYDPETWKYNLREDMTYRVRVLYGEGLAEDSDPVTVLGALTAPQLSTIHQMLRNHEIALRKGSGTPGFLLRRRLWGTECSVCVDPDLDTVASPRCTTCYGTGIVGGYYPAQNLYMQLQTQESSVEGMQPDGKLRIPPLQSMYISTLPLYQGDLWVNGFTGDRYLVKQTGTAEALFGVQTMGLCALDPVDPGDIVYLLPLAEEGSSSGDTSADDLDQHSDSLYS